MVGWGVIPGKQLYLGNRVIDGKNPLDIRLVYARCCKSLFAFGSLTATFCAPFWPLDLIFLNFCFASWLLLLLYLPCLLLKPINPEHLIPHFSFLYASIEAPVNHFSWLCLRKVTVPPNTLGFYLRGGKVWLCMDRSGLRAFIWSHFLRGRALTGMQ